MADESGTRMAFDGIEVPVETRLRLYEGMVRLRVLDERGLNLQRQGRIGFYAPATGQEAAVIGSGAAFEAGDWLFPSYREVGIALLRGASLRSIIAQLIGNRNDLIKGRQMPNHYAFRDLRFVSISSPIGTQIVQAVGAAMAAHYRRSGKEVAEVAGTWFGDGSTSSNDFHTGLNFAGVYQAPVVFICQNNGWAITLPVERQTAQPVLARKAEAYGFEGIRVDGNDVLAVYRATRHAVEKARRGEGPTLVEALTYRMGPHSTSDDPRRYRAEQEVEAWRARDPVAGFRADLLAEGLWSEAQEAALLDTARAEVAAAVDAEEAAGPPPLDSIFDDVWAGDTLPWNLQEQREEARRHHGA